MSSPPARVIDFFDGWEKYNSLLVEALSPLSEEQLSFRAAPGLWSVRTIANHIAAARARHKSDIETANPCRGVVQNIEPVPILANQPAIFGDAPGRAQNAEAVRVVGERPLPDDNHRVFGIAQHGGPGMVARGQCVQHSAVIAQHLDRKCEVESGTDRSNPKTALEMSLAQPRIDERRFPARVGADKQTRIRVFDAGNCRAK